MKMIQLLFQNGDRLLPKATTMAILILKYIYSGFKMMCTLLIIDEMDLCTYKFNFNKVGQYLVPF